MSDKCNSCNHIEVCGDNVVDFGCHYEPKRVKCKDCLVGIITDNLIYRSADVEGIFFDSKFKFCPKCGTEIKIL